MDKKINIYQLSKEIGYNVEIIKKWVSELSFPYYMENNEFFFNMKEVIMWFKSWSNEG